MSVGHLHARPSGQVGHHGGLAGRGSDMDGQKASLVLHSISLLCPGQQSHLGQWEFYGGENGRTDKIILGVGEHADDIEDGIFWRLQTATLVAPLVAAQCNGVPPSFPPSGDRCRRNLQVVTFTIGVGTTVKEQIDNLRPIVDCRPVQRGHPCLVRPPPTSCVLLQQLLHPVYVDITPSLEDSTFPERRAVRQAPGPMCCGQQLGEARPNHLAHSQ